MTPWEQVLTGFAGAMMLAVVGALFIFLAMLQDFVQALIDWLKRH